MHQTVVFSDEAVGFGNSAANFECKKIEYLRHILPSMVRALILAQTTMFLNQPQKQTMLSQKAVILRKPSGEVAESRGLTVFWILRLRFASRRMTKFAMFQYHDLCLCCFTNR